MVLNSPWFDMQGPILAAHRRHRGAQAASAHRQPMRRDPAQRHRLLRPQPAPRPRRRVGLQPGLEAAGVAARSTSAGCAPSAPATPSCTAASRWAARCWCCPPARTACPSEMGEDVHGHDIVLDVEQIRRWAPSVGRHVTVVAVEGARHDVVLSRPAGAQPGLRRAGPLARGVRQGGPTLRSTRRPGPRPVARVSDVFRSRSPWLALAGRGTVGAPGLIDAERQHRAAGPRPEHGLARRLSPVSSRCRSLGGAAAGPPAGRGSGEQERLASAATPTTTITTRSPSGGQPAARRWRRSGRR